LQREQKLLLSLSDFLCDNRMLRKNDIKRIAERDMSCNLDIIEGGGCTFYRERLKRQVKDFQVSKPSVVHYENVLSLNKKQQD
ncbi:MAG TPA: hypothetical protein VLH37_03340, partial [Bacteroidales bacterium]|nr:hypothetical protein [Bacteroidales bacterium]